MNKSFQESNGTVLSTNWKDIGSKRTECAPALGYHLRFLAAAQQPCSLALAHRRRCIV